MQIKYTVIKCSKLILLCNQKTSERLTDMLIMSVSLIVLL